METVISKDGTKIVFDKIGKGPTVILVDGAFNSRAFGVNKPLVPLLAEYFTVIAYDRRGRGDSGDTKPYAVEREIEDLAAIIKAVGAPVYLYGNSSGAALALEAASKLGSNIKKVVAYEVPFIVDDSRLPVPEDYVTHLNKLIATDRRSEAIKYFMTKGVGLPAIFLVLMHLMPAWSRLKAVAPSILYDVAIVEKNQRGKPLAAGIWRSITASALVMNGGKGYGWIRNAAVAIAEAIPHAQYRVLEGQTHIVKAKAIAPVLIAFFTEK